MGNVTRFENFRLSQHLGVKVDTETQLVLVLKGIGPETYRCLRDQEPSSSDREDPKDATDEAVLTTCDDARELGARGQ